MRFRAHGGDERVTREVRGGLVGNGLAVLHHYDAVGGGEGFAQQMGDQDDRRATRRLGFHEGKQLFGCDSVEG